MCERERVRESERERECLEKFLMLKKSVNGDLQLRAFERSNLDELEEKN